MRDIQYLVFSGGGAAGYAFGGALQQLAEEPDFSFDSIKGVAGVSVGCLPALLVSLKYSSAEISKVLSEIQFNQIKDSAGFLSEISRLYRQYGLYKGDYIFTLIKLILKEKTKRADPENVTFADLHNLGFTDLHIVTTKLYKENGIPTGKEKVFSYEKTPQTSVAAAILASTAVPFYFKRVRLKKLEKGKYILDDTGDLFQDGGVLNNFPIDIFDKPRYLNLPDDGVSTKINPHTLGLIVRYDYEMNDAKHVVVKTPLPDSAPFQFGVGVVNSLLLQYKKDRLNKAKNRERTVQIDRLGVGLNDFNMSKATKKALFESGSKAVRDYFHQFRLKETALLTSKALNFFKLASFWNTPKKAPIIITPEESPSYLEAPLSSLRK